MVPLPVQRASCSLAVNLDAAAQLKIRRLQGQSDPDLRKNYLFFNVVNIITVTKCDEDVAMHPDDDSSMHSSKEAV